MNGGSFSDCIVTTENTSTIGVSCKLFHRAPPRNGLKPAIKECK